MSPGNVMDYGKFKKIENNYQKIAEQLSVVEKIMIKYPQNQFQNKIIFKDYISTIYIVKYSDSNN